jgi:hypothetical protein
LAVRWVWRGRRRQAPAASEAERFVLFLVVLIAANLIALAPAPQEGFRYVVHLVPLSCIVAAWVVRRLWTWHRASAALLAALLGLTNWLHVLPMEWLGIVNRPWDNDPRMLTSPNLPLKLFLTELRRGYPDVNAGAIEFFRAHASAGDTIVTTYGDLPLQFYLPCRVLGGLQGRAISADEAARWIVPRSWSRVNREGEFYSSVRFVRESVDLAADYEAIALSWPDDLYGNQPDPYYHHFVGPVEPFRRLVIYRRKGS